MTETKQETESQPSTKFRKDPTPRAHDDAKAADAGIGISPASPLAQEFTVIAQINPRPDTSTGRYTIADAPSLVRLADGGLLCATPFVNRKRNPSGGTEDERRNWFRTERNVWDDRGLLHFHRSDDQGRTWKKLSQELEFQCGRLIQQGKTLYFLGVGRYRNGGIQISRSNDGGVSWAAPTRLFEGAYYQASTGMVIRDGRLYWCFGAASEQGKFNSYGSRTVVVAADFNRDLTQRDAWRISKALTFPSDALNGIRSGTSPSADHWLEGNVVESGGRLLVLWRSKIDDSTTLNLAAVCTLEDDGALLDYRFSRFYPVPGAHLHFHILRDDQTGIYWMTSQAGTRGRLALHCSHDALNWLHAAYLVVWPKATQASNYTGPFIDGQDLLFGARTAYQAPNNHDNDLVTFHRVRNFRSLAKPLMTEGRGLRDVQAR
ncbi:MAG: exo-alpha-sialidase [Planctomycetes bacterium]|nr:exo-alpha-sialidase [Planctomycetota bacterium]